MNIEDHIISQFDKLNGKIDILNEKISTLKEELSILKVKSGVWGSISGGIVAAFSYLVGR